MIEYSKNSREFLFKIGRIMLPKAQHLPSKLKFVRQKEIHMVEYLRNSRGS